MQRSVNIEARWATGLHEALGKDTAEIFGVSNQALGIAVTLVDVADGLVRAQIVFVGWVSCSCVVVPKFNWSWLIRSRRLVLNPDSEEGKIHRFRELHRFSML